MALFEYLKQTQRFMREGNQDLLNPGDLISYVNRARREISMRAMAIRVLTPISGQINNINLVSGGSGYSNNPTVTVSAPDFPSGFAPAPNGDQATAVAIVNNGVIQAIDVTYGGYGYWQPQVTITDTTGTGASATATTTAVSQLIDGQETYPVSAIDLSGSPGVESVYWVRRVSVIFSNWRYSPRIYSFTTYNAQIRTFPYQYNYAPFFCAMFGRGTGTQLFLYPKPSQSYQMELDCQCIPSDLIDDQSVEALPLPFTEAVPMYAAFLAMCELQNYNAAKFYEDMFNRYISRYSTYVQPGVPIDAYGGRW